MYKYLEYTFLVPCPQYNPIILLVKKYKCSEGSSNLGARTVPQLKPLLVKHLWALELPNSAGSTKETRWPILFLGTRSFLLFNDWSHYFTACLLYIRRML